MLNDFDKQQYITRYNDRLSKYGYDPKTLGWGGGRERQYLRFRELLRIAEYSATPIRSVLDIGCGFGDLYQYICERYDHVKYTGVDINDGLLQVAREIHGDAANFCCADIGDHNMGLGPHDVVIESGMFNAALLNQDQHDYIRSSLLRMYDLSKIGVAADFMTSHVDWKADGAFHLDPTEAIRIAMSISRRVVLRHDYLPYEYCIYILH